MILKEEIPLKSLPQVKVFILGPVDFSWQSVSLVIKNLILTYHSILPC